MATSRPWPDAICIANDNGEADTIMLGSGVYTLTIGGMNENAAGTDDLGITEDVTIVGLGPDQTTVNEVVFSFSNDQIADGFARLNGQSVNE